MTRGTTPTLVFELPIQCSEITKCSIALSQDSEMVIEKKLPDCETSENILTCTLSEEETLKLNSHAQLAIQLRIYCGAVKYASQIFEVPVHQILKDGVLE